MKRNLIHPHASLAGALAWVAQALFASRRELTRTQLCIAWLLPALLGLPGLAGAQGTTIGYQGRLSDSGLPATGLYDFTFSVFDAEVDGVALAGPLVRDAVAVTNGLFNVALDFGPNIFTGPDRWLEITVRTNGVGDPAVLVPRTALLPTPYSIFAGRAGGVTDSSLTAEQLNTGGTPPAPGQFLSYDGANLAWTDPGVAVGNTWLLNGANTYYNAGNVGIGTASPTSKLTISGAGYGFEHTDGTRRLSSYVSASGGWLGTRSADSLNFFINDGGSSMTIDAGGRVGIGTTTPAAKLTVRTTGAFSAYGIEHTDGTVRLSTYLDAGFGAWLGTRSAHGLNFFVNDGPPSLSIDTGGATTLSPAGGYAPVTFGTPNGESGLSIKGGNRADVRFNGSSLKMVAATGVGPPSSLNGIAVHTSGNVGIGTISPQAKLHVEGSGITEATIKSVNERAILSLDSTLAGQNRVWTLESGVFGTPGLFGIYDRGAGRARLTIDTAGVVGVDVLRINGGADLSEHFDIEPARGQTQEATPRAARPGMVACIDPENPGKLMLSSRAYDRRVAGIISGAGGVKPGMLMSQAGSIADGSQPVALTGRVYCFVDAGPGAIEPGDLLTTSDTPGHAMKVTDHARAQGAILGKAMSSLKDGQGLVLVLVTLQ